MDPAFYHALGQVRSGCMQRVTHACCGLPSSLPAAPALLPHCSLLCECPRPPAHHAMTPPPLATPRHRPRRSTSCRTGTTSRTASRWRTSSAAWSSSTPRSTATSRVRAACRPHQLHIRSAPEPRAAVAVVPKMRQAAAGARQPTAAGADARAHLAPPPPLAPPAAGVDRRSMLEIECAAKIGLSGGPLYYRCGAGPCWPCLAVAWLAVLGWLSEAALLLAPLLTPTPLPTLLLTPTRSAPRPPPAARPQVRHVRQPDERAHAPQLVPGLQGHALLLPGLPPPAVRSAPRRLQLHAHQAAAAQPGAPRARRRGWAVLRRAGPHAAACSWPLFCSPSLPPACLHTPCPQIALRMAVEVHTVHGATGTALQQAVLRQMGAVQRSYQAAAAAAAAAGVVDE